MGDRVRGKVVLITGAARGMGAAHARRLAAEGAQLVLGDVRDDELKALVSELEGEGHDVAGLHMDVTSENDWNGAVSEAEQRFGKLDVLVNNAAIISMGGVEETSLETWEQIVKVNQTGVFLGMKHCVPALRRAGGGSIINVSSIYGLVGSGGATAYQATKGAIRLMTKTAAVQYAPEGIRINSLHPGVIDTPMLHENVPAEMIPILVQMTPLGRMAQPEEISNGVLWLASDESSFMVGSELIIDGGYSTH